MEKIIRYILIAVICVLLATAGVFAVLNWSLGRELAGVRLNNTELRERLIRIEQGQYGIVEYIQGEVSKLDKELSDGLKRQQRGIEGMAGTLQILRKWGENHRSLEREIIDRLTYKPNVERSPDNR